MAAMRPKKLYAKINNYDEEPTSNIDFIDFFIRIFEMMSGPGEVSVNSRAELFHCGRIVDMI